METDLQIVPLAPERVPDAAALLREVALEFILPACAPEDAAAFLEQHGEAGLRGFIAAGYVYHAALAGAGPGAELAGFIGVRDRSHVFHLFVGRRWQRRGIARRLWECGRDAALGPDHPGRFTVNASNHAVPFYLSLGFERTAPLQDGRLPYNPMAWRVPGHVPDCAQ